jgi:hypothetical protein
MKTRIVTHKKTGRTGFYAGQIFQGARLLVIVRIGASCKSDAYRTQWAWENCLINPPVEKKQKNREPSKYQEYMEKFPVSDFL